MSSSGWEVRFSNSRQLPYFYNSTTSTSIWEKPEELSEDQAQLLPGSQYLKGTTNAAAAAVSNGASSLSSAPTNVTANGTVRASHLLVKHSQSRRPSSWKEVSFFILDSRGIERKNSDT
jgi:peptidyl-prolyl cis-trans isomerase NIMA-interacting 1